MDVANVAHLGRPVRVALVTNIPAPYRIPVWQQISDADDIELCVFYCSGKEPDREWELKNDRTHQVFLKERFVTFRGRFIHFNTDTWQRLHAFQPDVVVTTGFNPTHLLAFAYARWHRLRHVSMTDGTLQSETMTLTFLHRQVRRWVYARSQAFVGASDGSLDLYRNYGCDPERLFKSQLCANNAAFARTPPQAKRFDFVVSGQLIARKNPLFAIDVAHRVAQRLQRPISILFLGSGPMQAEMQARLAPLHEQVHAEFAGFVQQEALPALYKSARLMLLPTLLDQWAVVVNEACAAGLPVLISPFAGAAGELVRDGENGHVLPLDLNRWRDTAVRLLSHEATRTRMAERGLELVQDYHYAHAAQGLLQAVRQAMNKRVLIIQRHLTHYRVPLFESMRTKLATMGVQLDVVYGNPAPYERSKRDEGRLPWGHHTPCHYWLNGKLCWQHLDAARRQADLVIITQENKMLLNYVLMLLHPPRLAFWGHGANLQSKHPRGLRERFKRWTSRRVDWWFAYTKLSHRLVQASGFATQRITVVNNAIDVTTLQAQCASVRPAEVEALRKSLDMDKGPVGIFVGSLHTDKRLGFLLDAAQAIRARIPDFQLLIVGDGPQRELVHSCSIVHPWIHWTGARTGHDKAVCLSMARVMLNPGLVGLGILDAFAAGLPMVTTQWGRHSPEIVYLENGINGLMTADDLNGYVQETVALMGDEARLARLRTGCHASASEFTLEHMVDRFCAGVLQCLQTPAPRSGART